MTTFQKFLQTKYHMNFTSENQFFARYDAMNCRVQDIPGIHSTPTLRFVSYDAKNLAISCEYKSLNVFFETFLNDITKAYGMYQSLLEEQKQTLDLFNNVLKINADNIINAAKDAYSLKKD